MGCDIAPVINRLGQDWETHFQIPDEYNVPGPGGVYLGSKGDQNHANRPSSHNCSPWQESCILGVCYAPDLVHARDARPSTHAIGMEMVDEHLHDDRTRYVLYDNMGFKPDGETWTLNHPTFHVSVMPGTHNDTRPWFGPRVRPPLTDQQKRTIFANARKMIHDDPRPNLRVKNPPMRGKYVREVQIALNAPRTGVYGPGTRDAVKVMQGVLGLERTGEVNQALWIWVIYFAFVKAYENGR